MDPFSVLGLCLIPKYVFKTKITLTSLNDVSLLFITVKLLHGYIQVVFMFRISSMSRMQGTKEERHIRVLVYC